MHAILAAGAMIQNHGDLRCGLVQVPSGVPSAVEQHWDVLIWKTETASALDVSLSFFNMHYLSNGH